jgi:hypothetical protein
VSIACGVVALSIAALLPRTRRITAMLLLLVAFVALTISLPLPERYNDIGYMGDGLDFVQNPKKYDVNIPFAGSQPVLYFTAHLGNLILATVYRSLGSTESAPITAYRTLSAVGAVLCALELAAVLLVFRGARRACRFVALALAAPFTLGYYGYYEVGYMAISAGAFPLLVRGLSRRAYSGPLTDGAAAVQGLHAAFHGMGLLGIAGGVFTIAIARITRRGWTLSRYIAFATAAYLGWIAFYVLVLHVGVQGGASASAFAFRSLTTSFYFDRRLVDPLVSRIAWSEIGAASLATGVPLLVFGTVMMRRSREWVAAVTYASPGLLFLILWWPTLGPRGDLDLLLAVFYGIAGASWLASRSARSASFGLGVLALAHVAFWAAIATAAFDRAWIAQAARQGFEYLFLGSFPTMCSTSWLFSLQMYSISSVSLS